MPGSDELAFLHRPSFPWCFFHRIAKTHQSGASASVKAWGFPMLWGSSVSQNSWDVLEGRWGAGLVPQANTFSVSLSLPIAEA